MLPRIATDVLALLWAATRGELKTMKLAVRGDYALCVVIAAQGYPESYAKGDAIVFPEKLPDGVSIIHAGTAKNATGQIVTAGGRVLGITALAPTLSDAAGRAYAACATIQCAGKYYRRDIGARQLNRR